MDPQPPAGDIHAAHRGDGVWHVGCPGCEHIRQWMIHWFTHHGAHHDGCPWCERRQLALV
jgi:hypothetical protein